MHKLRGEIRQQVGCAVVVDVLTRVRERAGAAGAQRLGQRIGLRCAEWNADCRDARGQDDIVIGIRADVDRHRLEGLAQQQPPSPLAPARGVRDIFAAGGERPVNGLTAGHGIESGEHARAGRVEAPRLGPDAQQEHCPPPGFSGQEFGGAVAIEIP